MPRFLSRWDEGKNKSIDDINDNHQRLCSGSTQRRRKKRGDVDERKSSSEHFPMTHFRFIATLRLSRVRIKMHRDQKISRTCERLCMPDQNDIPQCLLDQLALRSKFMQQQTWEDMTSHTRSIRLSTPDMSPSRPSFLLLEQTTAEQALIAAFLWAIQKNNPRDWSREVCLRMMMNTQSPSDRYPKRSDYIGHSGKSQTCMGYLNVNLRTTRRTSDWSSKKKTKRLTPRLFKLPAWETSCHQFPLVTGNLRSGWEYTAYTTSERAAMDVNETFLLIVWQWRNFIICDNCRSSLQRLDERE